MCLEGRKIIDGQKFGDTESKAVQEFGEIIGPGDGNGNIADGIFQKKIPTDDPGNQFAERIISIGIGTPGNRDAGSKFSVT